MSYNDLHPFITWVFIGYIPYDCCCVEKKKGGCFKYVFFSPRSLGKIPILTHIFQMGWFNHQLENQLAMINHQQITIWKNIFLFKSPLNQHFEAFFGSLPSVFCCWTSGLVGSPDERLSVGGCTLPDVCAIGSGGAWNPAEGSFSVHGTCLEDHPN